MTVYLFCIRIRNRSADEILIEDSRRFERKEKERCELCFAENVARL